MRRSLRVGFLFGLILVVAALSFAGCGGKHGADSHHDGAEAAAAPPPTPDTTPIEALRTPAGLVLKIDTSTTPTRTPSPAPTPAPSS